MEADIVPGRLLIIDGKSADFEPESEDEGNGKIVLKHTQSKKSNLSVYMESKDKKTYMGFCFVQKQNSYVLGVEGEEICFKIQAKDQPKDFSNKFLFKWDSNKGSYGSLNSVAEPSRYLCVHETEVTLSSTPVNLFKVSLETGNLQSRSLSMPYSGIKFGHTRHTRMQCRGLCCIEEPQQKVIKQSRKRKACVNQS